MVPAAAPPDPDDELPQLLSQARAGQAGAVGRLVERLYPELRRIAHSRLRAGSPDSAVDTGALVHETYLRLARQAALPVADAPHFMAYAATAMRSVLVDIARERQAERRGGDAQHLALTTGLGERLAGPEPELLQVHEALAGLAAVDPRLASVVELRYFGGLANAEIAAALGLSLRTVERSWEQARSYLYAMLRPA